MEETLGNLKQIILREGIILAAIPAISYYSAFQYEVGYYRAFGAPENLISVDISTLIAFGTATLGIVFGLSNFVVMLWHSLDRLTEMSWKQSFIILLKIFLFLYFL